MGLRDNLKTFTIFVLLIASSKCSLDASFKSGLEHFSHNLFHELVKSQGQKNIIFSPFSAQTCLAIARMGAAGVTAAEIDSAMGCSGKGTDFIANNYFNLLSHYENSTQVHVATKMYVRESSALQENFNQILSEKFYTASEPINFDESAKAAKTMNSWVESKTNNLIKDVISSDMLTSDTRLVLLNAIHFKGEWLKQFDASKTKDGLFYTDETEAVTVPLMHKSDHFQYGRLHSLKAMALRLPYRDSDLSMLIILPYHRNGLLDVQEKLQTISLESITASLTSTKVQVTLPKFKTESTLMLKDPLLKLQMDHLFEHADFSNMLKSPEPLSVSAIVQKAFIEVNEVGTEAAAATAILWEARSMPPRFLADHPFHYVILNDENVVLFQGNVVNPLLN